MIVGAAWIAGTMAVLAAGCECGERRTQSAGRAGTGTGSAAATGTVVVTVHLAPGAELPQYPESPVQVEGRPPIPPECTPPRQADRTPVVPAEQTGGLVNLVVVVTGRDEHSWPDPGEPRTHEVAIRDCRLTPSVIVATRGDRLRLVNATDYPFFPDLGDGVLQYRTEPREVTLDRGGVRTIQCGFAAPCGRLELVTLYHPVHGVTGSDGRARIEGVPADQPVRVTAWHPLFREAATTTTVPAGGTVDVEMTIEPAPMIVPPREESAGAGSRGPVEANPDPNVPF